MTVLEAESATDPADAVSSEPPRPSSVSRFVRDLPWLEGAGGLPRASFARASIPLRRLHLHDLITSERPPPQSLTLGGELAAQEL